MWKVVNVFLCTFFFLNWRWKIFYSRDRLTGKKKERERQTEKRDDMHHRLWPVFEPTMLRAQQGLRSCSSVSTFEIQPQPVCTREKSGKKTWQAEQEEARKEWYRERKTSRKEKRAVKTACNDKQICIGACVSLLSVCAACLSPPGWFIVRLHIAAVHVEQWRMFLRGQKGVTQGRRREAPSSPPPGPLHLPMTLQRP